MYRPQLLVIAIGAVLGLIVAVLTTWRRFRMANLLALVALVACLLGLVRIVVREAQHAAAQSACGGG